MEGFVLRNPSQLRSVRAPHSLGRVPRGHGPQCPLGKSRRWSYRESMSQYFQWMLLTALTGRTWSSSTPEMTFDVYVL